MFCNFATVDLAVLAKPSSIADSLIRFEFWRSFMTRLSELQLTSPGHSKVTIVSSSCMTRQPELQVMSPGPFIIATVS